MNQNCCVSIIFCLHIYSSISNPDVIISARMMSPQCDTDAVWKLWKKCYEQRPLKTNSVTFYVQTWRKTAYDECMLQQLNTQRGRPDFAYT